MSAGTTIARRSHCNRCDQPYTYDMSAGRQLVCDDCLEDGHPVRCKWCGRSSAVRVTDCSAHGDQ
jgi:primosomal protein N'